MRLVREICKGIAVDSGERNGRQMVNWLNGEVVREDWRGSQEGRMNESGKTGSNLYLKENEEGENSRY